MSISSNRNKDNNSESATWMRVTFFKTDKSEIKPQEIDY